MEKGTKEIIKNIAIIVLVPTVLAGAYYGFKFVHKKIKDKKQKEKDANTPKNKDDAKTPVDAKQGTGIVDTTGMEKYTISVPVKLQKELFSDGKFFDSILKINYSSIDNTTKDDMFNVNIMLMPKDLQLLTDTVQKLNKEITVNKTVV